MSYKLYAMTLGVALAVAACSPKGPEPSNEDAAAAMPGAEVAAENADAVSPTTPPAADGTAVGANPQPGDATDGSESEEREGGGEDRPG